jgi:ribonuclease BN (tRNA processing enzyme)
VRLTVLGACGAWPGPGQACSGYLVEHAGFHLLMDIGYAVVPRLLERLPADRLDAVIVSHGHPDHCADLGALLRARTMRDQPAPPLPVYALPGALDAVLALDRPGLLDRAVVLHELEAAKPLGIGPFDIRTRLLPHSVPNLGVRLEADGKALAYTGDSGPSPEVIRLARDADLLLAEATFSGRIPSGADRFLSSATEAGSQARRAQARSLVLTHLTPGTDADLARREAAAAYNGPVDVAASGLTFEI